MKYDLGDVVVKRRERLPHWHAEHAIYFVTWHEAGALPMTVLARLRAEQAERLQQKNGPASISRAEECASRREFVAACERLLDQHALTGCLETHAAAAIVGGAIEFFDQRRYSLLAYAVMPNHVHVVLSPCGEAVSRILHSIKSYTSKQINGLLRRSGVVWQRESFDRCIRSSSHLLRTISYVQTNPLKAGLHGWPFVRTYPERIAEVI